jgi:hypothetical protein
VTFARPPKESGFNKIPNEDDENVELQLISMHGQGLMYLSIPFMEAE